MDNYRKQFYKKLHNSGVLSMQDFLRSLSFDELLEVDMNTGSLNQIHHIVGKYSTPLAVTNYEELYQCVLDNIVHPEDKAVYEQMMNPDHFFERLEKSDIRNFDCAIMRFKLQSGGYRYIEQETAQGSCRSLAAPSGRDAYGVQQEQCRPYLHLDERRLREVAHVSLLHEGVGQHHQNKQL